MKRVLIVTYYFPPSGGAGVQRALKFVRYLPEFGWMPIVLTLDPRYAAYPEIDASLSEEISESISVHRTKASNPFVWYAKLTGRKENAVKVGSLKDLPETWQERLSKWIRANLFIPDARIGWRKEAVRTGLKLLKEQNIDIIFTTSPPASAHLIGLTLHQKTNLPWVADFRDPWTDINFYHELPHTKWALQKDKALEKKVLETANHITVVSPSWKQLLASKIDTKDKFSVIYNGFDTADIPLNNTVSNDYFWITYVGNLYASRNPKALWEALTVLLPQMPQLRLRFVGSLDSVVLQSLQQNNLYTISEVLGYMPHQQAVRYMQQSQLLLLFIEKFKANAGMIPGKLYEYLATQRPILGLGPVAGDAHTLLKTYQAGSIVEYENTEAIQDYLIKAYRKWEKQKENIFAKPDLSPLMRKTQTAQLAQCFEQLVQR